MRPRAGASQTSTSSSPVTRTETVGPPADQHLAPCPPRPARPRWRGRSCCPRARTSSPGVALRALRARCARRSPPAPGSRRAGRRRARASSRPAAPRSAPARHRRARHHLHGLARRQRLIGPLAGADLARDLEHDGRVGHVGGAHRVAVHGRAVEGRHVGVRAARPRRARGRAPPRAATSSDAEARGVREDDVEGARRRGSCGFLPYCTARTGPSVAGRPCVCRMDVWRRAWSGRSVGRRIGRDDRPAAAAAARRSTSAAATTARWRRPSATWPCAARPPSASPPPSASRSERARAAAEGAALRARVRRDLRADARHAADRGQPLLGHRAHAPAVRADEPRGGAALRDGLLAEAQAIHDEDLAACHRMGDLGAALITRAVARPHPLQRRRAGHRRLRHRAGRDPLRRARRATCSACSPTRRGPISRARASPPGSSMQDGIPTTLIADNMAGHMMAHGAGGRWWWWARTASPANGDVANKIGTYSRGRAGQGERHPVLRGRARLHLRPRDRLRRRDPDRGASRGRGHAPRRPAPGPGGRDACATPPST